MFAITKITQRYDELQDRMALCCINPSRIFICIKSLWWVAGPVA